MLGLNIVKNRVVICEEIKKKKDKKEDWKEKLTKKKKAWALV